MILYVKGDLFQAPAQVLVNTVNTVGVMGKGIALDFRRLFPEMFEQYRALCEAGTFQIGTLWLYKTPNKWVLNFPTKKHWREPSRVEYIEAGLKKFVTSYASMGIHSIAFPPLGCGNGQLDFATQVQPLMEKYLHNLPIEVFIYPERASRFVEHLDQKEMERWLRSEPTSMPFAEVWHDLSAVLQERSVFTTLGSKREFKAQINEQSHGITISTARRKTLLPYDVLMAFWQQLRIHGFSMRHIAPGVDRHLAYMIPIFSALSYVGQVQIAEEFDNLHSERAIGLQVLPPAFDKSHVNASGMEQPPLL
jgi:O-acetyl-ADP-ribose deacetylase (regulator of RNase III)